MQKTIRLSLTKREWMAIGAKANWLKTAGIPPVRLPIDELMRRVESIGWDVKELKGKGGAHYKCTAPLGDYSNTVTVHDYESKPHTWKSIMNSFTRYSRDLQFVFRNPFVIPENFNMITQKIEQEIPSRAEPPSRDMLFRNLPANILENYVIRHDNQWKRPIDIDYNHGAIMFEDGSLLILENPTEILTIRLAFQKNMLVITSGIKTPNWYRKAQEKTRT